MQEFREAVAERKCLEVTVGNEKGPLQLAEGCRDDQSVEAGIDTTDSKQTRDSKQTTDSKASAWCYM